jgi:hypothetical protein
LLKQPCAIHLAAICCKLEKVKSTKSLFFKMALGSHLAATWWPLGSHLRPLAATWQPLGSHLLQPLEQVSAKWLQVAASCKWLTGQVAASGCKWLQVADRASGCKWLQVADIWKIKMMHVCSPSEISRFF